jgi:hypothetical protein
MQTAATVIFKLLEKEQVIVSLDDYAAGASIPGVPVWYAVAGVRMPDERNLPPHMVGILDADNQKAEQSRYFADGTSLDLALIRVVVRTHDMQAGMDKIYQLAYVLDSVQNYSVGVSQDTTAAVPYPRTDLVTVLSCNRLDAISSRGLDGTSRRYLFEARYSVRIA